MNKHLFITGMLCLGIAHPLKAVTNKTFLAPRADGCNIVFEQTPNLINPPYKHQVNRFGGTSKATFFMNGSTEKKALAKYFLFADKAIITLPRAAVGNTIGSTQDIDIAYFIHGIAQPETNNTTLALEPERNVIGTTFHYHQTLPWWDQRVSLQIGVPLVHVRNKLAAKAAGDERALLQAFLTGTRDLFVEDGVAQNLLFAKVPLCQRTRTAVADVELSCSGSIIKTKTSNLSINVGCTIPAGNVPNGEWMFDAIVGNNGHLGIGGGAQADVLIWHKPEENYRLSLHVGANYRYLFENDEVRTLGITNQRFGQYMLLLDRTKNTTIDDQIMKPAANVTTLRVDVTPGNLVDTHLGMSVYAHHIMVNAGYNLFYRDQEKVGLSHDARGYFPDNVWAIATRNAPMNTALTGPNIPTPMNPMSPAGSSTNAQPDRVYRTIDRADLDTAAAQTPSLLSHKLYLGVTYATPWLYSLWNIGCGGHYEWAQADLITNWGLNASVGIGF